MTTYYTVQNLLQITHEEKRHMNIPFDDVIFFTKMSNASSVIDHLGVGLYSVAILKYTEICTAKQQRIYCYVIVIS